MDISVYSITHVYVYTYCTDVNKYVQNSQGRMDRKRAKDHVEALSVKEGQVKKPRMEEGCAEMNSSYASEDFLERLTGCWK